MGWLELRPVSVVPGRHHVESDARTLIRDQEASSSARRRTWICFWWAATSKGRSTLTSGARDGFKERVLPRRLCRECICVNGSAGFPRRHAQVVLRCTRAGRVLASLTSTRAVLFMTVRESWRQLGDCELIERTNRVDPATVLDI